MSTEITIKLTDGSDVCKIEHQKQLKNRTISSSKIITIEDLLSILSKKIELTNAMIIPKNLAMTTTSNTRTRYYFDFPAQKRQIKVVNRGGKPIYNNLTLTPRTIFVVTPDKSGKIYGDSIKVYAATGTQQLTTETSLYHLPMYNIFSSDAICWGTYKYDFGTTETINKCSDLDKKMYDATCNLDLNPAYSSSWASRHISGYADDPNFIRVLKYLENKDEYPEELLMPTHLS